MRLMSYTDKTTTSGILDIYITNTSITYFNLKALRYSERLLFLS